MAPKPMPKTKIFEGNRYTLHNELGHSLRSVVTIGQGLRNMGWWVRSVHGGKGRDHRYYLYKRRKK